jgi:hypothetical protein
MAIDSRESRETSRKVASQTFTPTTMLWWGRLQTDKTMTGSLGYGRGLSQSRHGAKISSGRYDSFLRGPSFQGPSSRRVSECSLGRPRARQRTLVVFLWIVIACSGDTRGCCDITTPATGIKKSKRQDKPRPTGMKTPWQRLRLRCPASVA